jgi:hypothetical protein
MSGRPVEVLKVTRFSDPKKLNSQQDLVGQEFPQLPESLKFAHPSVAEWCGRRASPSCHRMKRELCGLRKKECRSKNRGLKMDTSRLLGKNDSSSSKGKTG